MELLFFLWGGERKSLNFFEREEGKSRGKIILFFCIFLSSFPPLKRTLFEDTKDDDDDFDDFDDGACYEERPTSPKEGTDKSANQ